MAKRICNTRGVNIGDASVRYNGRTLKIDVLINTDEPVEDVVARIQSAARGPKQCMALLGGGEVDADTAKKIWADLLPAVTHQAKQGGHA